MNSRTTNPPLSVAEVIEIVPSEDSWINDGVKAVVRSIKQPPANASKKFWKCVLADEVGSATINLTVFQAPKFGEGDLIEITGQGIKRKEYNGAPEISVGQKSEIHRIGRSAHHEEQVERAATGAPAVNGEPQGVAGQTVGMALKEAIALVLAKSASMSINDPQFWGAVHTCASDIIRVSRLLEHGKLAPPVKERGAAGTDLRSGGATLPARQPQPVQQTIDEDVPF